MMKTAIKEVYNNGEAIKKEIQTSGKFKAIALKVEHAFAFFQGIKHEEERTSARGVKVGERYLFCASSTPYSNGFAFMTATVTEIEKIHEEHYIWHLGDFFPVVPFPVKCGQWFWTQEVENEFEGLYEYQDRTGNTTEMPVEVFESVLKDGKTLAQFQAHYAKKFNAFYGEPA